MLTIGDLILYKPKPLHMCVCTSIDLQNGIFTACIISDSHGSFLQNQQNGMSIQLNEIGASLEIVSWTGKQYIDVLNVNNSQIPGWIQQSFPNSTIVNKSFSTPPSAPTVYPIGAMFLGSGANGNVYIINRDKSRDVSMLWKGRSKRWCHNATEFTDNIKAANTPKFLNFVEVEDFIRKHHGVEVRGTWPQWVKVLWGTALPSGPRSGHLPVSGPVINPAVVPGLVKAGVLKQCVPEKKVDSVRETCNHQFIQYFGFREVYEFCVHCDKKRPIGKDFT